MTALSDKNQPDINGCHERLQWRFPGLLGGSFNHLSTFLIIAVATEALDRVELLLQGGADINGEDQDGLTPLRMALHTENLAMINFLLERDAKINNSEIGIASSKQNFSLCEMLMRKKGLAFNDFDSDGDPYWFWIALCKTGFEDTVASLKRNKIDVNLPNKEGETILVYAARHRLCQSFPKTISLRNDVVDLMLSFAEIYGDSIDRSQYRIALAYIEKMKKDRRFNHEEKQTLQSLINILTQYTNCTFPVVSYSGNTEGSFPIPAGSSRVSTAATPLPSQEPDNLQPRKAWMKPGTVLKRFLNAWPISFPGRGGPKPGQ